MILENEILNFLLSFLLVTMKKLSPVQRPLCVVGRLGRKKTNARRKVPSPFYFFDYCYFYRDTQREPLWRREIKKETVEVGIV